MRPKTLVEHIALCVALAVFGALGAAAFIPQQMLFERAFGFGGHEVASWAVVILGGTSIIGYGALLIGLIGCLAKLCEWMRKRW